MKYTLGALFLAAILCTAAPAFADTIPAYSRGGDKDTTLSQRFTDQENSRDGSVRNTLLNAVDERGARFNPIEDFDVNQGASFEKDKVKFHKKHHGGDGDGGAGTGGGNGNGGNGGGVSGPTVPVAEPGSQSLLLFGLAGLGMFFYRRNTQRNVV